MLDEDNEFGVPESIYLDVADDLFKEGFSEGESLAIANAIGKHLYMMGLI